VSTLRAVFLSSALLAGLTTLTACKPEAVRSAEIERLQAKVLADRDFLIQEAENADPTRKDLKVTFVDSSIMDIRPTNNEQRPYVGHVRIRWTFAHADGRPIGDAVWDYVYALTPDHQWVKADEAPVPVSTPDVPKDDAPTIAPTIAPTPAGAGPTAKPA